MTDTPSTRTLINALDAFEKAEARAHDARPEEAPADLIGLARMGDLAAKRLQWLWPDRIPLGKVTVMAGEGGVGKSTLLFDLAARVTRGGALPGGGTAPQGNVLVLSADDDLEDTVLPRVAAAGADTARIVTITRFVEAGWKKPRQLTLPGDVGRFDQVLDEIGDVRLLIIDPLTAYLASVRQAAATEVRQVLGPLGALAARRNMAIVCNTHFSRGKGTRANDRILGPMALVHHARSALVVIPHPDRPGERLLLPSKSNISRLADALAFAIDPCRIEGPSGPIETIRVAWQDEAVAMSADAALTALAAGERAGDRKAEAIVFLRETLARGPQPAVKVLKLARQAGIQDSPLRLARQTLGMRPTKAGFGSGWVWSLPAARPGAL